MHTSNTTDSIYPTWRVWLLHLIAKALGVLVHVEGFPYGSVRLYRKSEYGKPRASGSVGISGSIPSEAGR